MQRHLRGFTLVELLVVLVILGLLAGLVGPRLMKYVGSSRVETARLQVNDLGAALDLYHLEVGRYPSTEEGLRALVEAPGGETRWAGPYLRKRSVPADPWGNPYRYRAPGENAPYELRSYGADGEPGGSGENADISAWE